MMVVVIIIIITIIIILKPRHSVTLHIRPPPFAVSVHTLQSLIYISSSPSPTPSSQCSVDSRFLLLWESQNICSHCQKSPFYVIWKKSRHSAFRTECLLITGTQLFKTNDSWTAPRKFGTNGIPNKVALGQVFLRVLQFFRCQLHATNALYSFIYHIK